MNWHGLAVFALAFLVLGITPGPGVAATVGQVLNRGLAAVPAFGFGIFLGDVVWYTLAATGLAALAQTHAQIFDAVRWLGGGYLTYIAYRLWSAKAPALGLAAESQVRSQWGQFLGGLTLTLSNPKSIVFFLAVLPAIVDIGSVTIASYLAGLAVIAIIVFIVLGGYALAAHWARGFFQSPPALRALNLTAAAALLMAAFAIVLRR